MLLAQMLSTDVGTSMLLTMCSLMTGGLGAVLMPERGHHISWLLGWSYQSADGIIGTNQAGNWLTSVDMDCRCAQGHTRALT